MPVTFLTDEDKQELLDSIDASVDTLKNTLVTEEVNLLPLYPTEDKVMSKTDTKVVFYNNTDYKTVFVPVEAGKTYYISYLGATYTNIRRAVLDTDKAGAASAYTQEDIYAGTAIALEIQSDGYCAICLTVSNYNSGQIAFTEGKPYTGEGGYTLSGAVELAPEHIEQVKKAQGTSTVEGKKLGVIGDSITYGSALLQEEKRWWQYVKERYGFANVYSNAEIGRAFTQDGMTSTRFTQKIKELPTDLDVIIVFGGVNDRAFNATIGTMEDEPAEDNKNISFYSALRFTAEYLLTNHPNARIIFMTPLPCNQGLGFNGKNTAGFRLQDYADAVAEMCRAYGFDMVDLNRVGGFYVWSEGWLADHMEDGIHPNNAGTQIYVKNGILPKLDSIFFERYGVEVSE